MLHLDCIFKQQKDKISRFANTALSELSAQANSLTHISDGLNRHLLDERGASVWINTNRYNETEHSSAYYRDYKKQETLTQLGTDTIINTQDGDLMLGIAYSHADVKNHFADYAQSESNLDMLSIYSKLTFHDDSFISADIGYGQSDNTIFSEGEEVRFKRNIASTGINIGKTFKTTFIDIQPSVGVRYHYLEGRNYDLNQANIKIDDINLISYRAGISLEKSFTLANGIQIKPSITTNYIDSNQDKASVIVNDINLQQQFGRYGYHEVGVSVGSKLWEVELHASHAEGNEINRQNAGGIKLSYKW